MPITVAYAIALGEARSCLAALADTADHWWRDREFDSSGGAELSITVATTQKTYSSWRETKAVNTRS